MPKKPYSYNEMSEVYCKKQGCNKLLKKNVLQRFPNAAYCYKHWMEIKRREQNRRTKNHKPNYAKDADREMIGDDVNYGLSDIGNK